MSALRDELHELVDQLPDGEIAPVLELARQRARRSRRIAAAAALADVQERMRGATGIDEELHRLRDEDRG
ncbi:hypothetical protein [Nocardia brasiliensis]|uniref:hypothetical protein n=1 Tax=Nocardia brasiliensis TaxID=37326 RepID=UPI00142D9189|nr:hypothetical protein [Nocardia brasiliensis]